MSLTKDDLADSIQRKSGCTIKESRNMLEIILEELKNRLEYGEEVKISGFGRWEIRDKRKRQGRNPLTGDPLEISARRVVTFRPSKKLKQAINTPPAAPSSSSPTSQVPRSFFKRGA